MKQKILAGLKRLGHFQAQIFLILLFVLILVPYALVLRLFVRSFLPDGRWSPVEEHTSSLNDLRRSF